MIPLFFVQFFSLLNAQVQDSVLSAEEITLVNKVEINSDLSIDFKKLCHGKLFQLPHYDKFGKIISYDYPGLACKVDEGRGNSLVLQNRNHFKKKGNFLFKHYDSSMEQDEIGIIPGKNYKDLLNYKSTNGFDSDIFTRDIIDQVESWKNEYDLIITGAGSYWIELFFIILPRKPGIFIDELVIFAPGILNDFLSKQNLLNELITKRKILVTFM